MLAQLWHLDLAIGKPVDAVWTLKHTLGHTESTSLGPTDSGLECSANISFEACIPCSITYSLSGEMGDWCQPQVQPRPGVPWWQKVVLHQAVHQMPYTVANSCDINY